MEIPSILYFREFSTTINKCKVKMKGLKVNILTIGARDAAGNDVYKRISARYEFNREELNCS